MDMLRTGEGAPDLADATPAPRTLAPRIYYLHPLLAGPLDDWDSQFARIAALGFNHVLIAPPFATGRAGSLLLTADPDRIDARLAPNRPTPAGLARAVEAARGAGLRLWLDVVLDRIAEDSPLAGSGRFFRRPDEQGALDPRHAAPPFGAALTDWQADEALLWWQARLIALAETGVAGFRLLGLNSVPASALAALTGAVRARVPDAGLIAWTPGLTEPARARLPRLDFVVPSLPWWDFAASWLWPEIESLAPHGRLLAAAEAPFGPRTAPAADAARMMRFARALGEGWLMPMGYEHGATAPLDPARDTQTDWDRLAAAPVRDLTAAVRAVNAIPALPPGPPRPLTAPGAPVTAMLRGDGDPRRAREASVVLLGPPERAGRAQAATIQASTFLTASGALVGALHADGRTFGPECRIAVGPNELQVLDAEMIRLPERPVDPAATAQAACAAPRLAIEAISPAVDGGAFPVKRTLGEIVTVEADVITDGHEQTSVALLWRRAGEKSWHQGRMRPLGNDRWQGSFPLSAIGRHEFTVEAWRDAFATWVDEVAKKHAAGVDTRLELQEGRHLVAEAARDDATVAGIATRIADLTEDGQRALLLSADVAAAMAAADRRPGAVRHEPMPVEADRAGAAFASWYEIFPRSMSDDEHRHGTFDDVIRHLPRIAGMGFDVVYFPPVHPIGRTNRKGRDNTLTPAPDDPGSPYAIGSPEGGHDAIHPELGTLEDFRRLVAAAADHGLEIAIDFAIQCSPDHPWLREHRDWFDWRPDGSIKYAENPPKKYQDIVNVDFYASGARPALWVALAKVVLFWCKQGVRLFRVDNPHTKPFPFWEWLIATVRAAHPDAVFLAEAFTRPKVMYRLAKIGFGQSYTYFTWRNTKAELTEYLTELTTAAPREFFRPHFFVNTPDINPPFLQTGGRPAHLIRAALAATLSGLWGVYSGFELCEATPLPGREEYAASEKYQLRAWDWRRPGNIVAEITALNRLRRESPALRSHLTLRFLDIADDAMLWFEKATEDRSDVILVAISLDPFNPRSGEADVPLWRWSLPDGAALVVENLIDGTRETWQGRRRSVALGPDRPYALWRARPAGP